MAPSFSLLIYLPASILVPPQSRFSQLPGRSLTKVQSSPFPAQNPLMASHLTPPKVTPKVLSCNTPHEPPLLTSLILISAPPPSFLNLDPSDPFSVLQTRQAHLRLRTSNLLCRPPTPTPRADLVTAQKASAQMSGIQKDFPDHLHPCNIPFSRGSVSLPCFIFHD